MAQGALQGWLHLHVAELGDGKVQVLQRLSPLPGIVLQEQLGELKPGEGDLGPKPNFLASSAMKRTISGSQMLAGHPSWAVFCCY